MTDEVIGVFRKCRRCLRWRSIDLFPPPGRPWPKYRTYAQHVCVRCAHMRADGIARARAIVITPKGRAALREAEVAAVA